MPVAWMPRKEAEVIGPRPPDEALDQFQVFFNATNYEDATEAFAKAGFSFEHHCFHFETNLREKYPLLD